MTRQTSLRSLVSGARGVGISLIAATQRRITVPGDTPTRQFQKMLVVIVSLIGSVTTVFNAIPFFEGFLPTMGRTYMVSAVVLFLGAVTILWRPSLYEPVTFVILTNVLVIATVTQVLSGGYNSGLLAMPWTLLAPLGAVLTLRRGLAVIQLIMFVAAAVVVVRLEPYSRSIAPFIAPGVMRRYNVSSLISLGLISAAPSLYLLRQVERYREEAERLLLNVLPRAIADRLKAGEAPIADGYENVTILFADMVDSTRLAAQSAPDEVVALLNEIYSEFDDLAAKHGVEKVKTIGDTYMAAAGLTGSTDDPAKMIAFALDLQDTARAKTWPNGEPVRFRIGIHNGPVVAGVIGHERLIYDVWGDAVNMAARMESTGPVDGIQVTGEVKALLGDRYRFEERNAFDVKGKGLTVTYTLETVATAASSDPGEPAAVTAH